MSSAEPEENNSRYIRETYKEPTVAREHLPGHILQGKGIIFNHICVKL